MQHSTTQRKTYSSMRSQISPNDSAPRLQLAELAKTCTEHAQHTLHLTTLCLLLPAITAQEHCSCQIAGSVQPLWQAAGCRLLV